MQTDGDQTVIVNLDQLVPPDHVLRRLKALFPWEEWARPFEKTFKGEKEYGPHGYPVRVLLKMTVLSFLYDLSDPQTETFVRENNPARYFLGLSLLQPVPDETTLCRFRNRILARQQERLLTDLFDRVLQQAAQRGVVFGRVQVFDSVHTTSQVNTGKDAAAKQKRAKNGEPPRPPQDPDATWGCKGTFTVTDPATGEKREQAKWFYGYKTHVSLNQKTRLVTSLLVSTGKDADITAARPLLMDDLKKGLRPTVAVGDKAYDDIDLYTFCGQHQIFPAISLKKPRLTQKSAKNRQKWAQHQATPWYKKALQLRYKVEAKFGEAKTQHGLRVTRYLGLKKFLFQSVLTFLTLNLKRILKLVTRPGAPTPRYVT